MKQITTMWFALLFLLGAVNTSSATEPEDTIRFYVKAFASQDFRGAMAWFHPDYQAAIREKVASIIAALREEDQLKVVEEYGAETIDEFRAMPTSETTKGYR